MPGLDHDVHPDTRDGAPRYGCHNHEREPGYWAPNMTHRRMPPMRSWHWIEDTMSKDCRFDVSLSDPKCEGCAKRGQGEAYAEDIRKRGT